MRSVLVRSVYSAMALVSVLMQCACGTGAGGDITGSDFGAATRASGPVLPGMEGTWSGTNESVQLVWRLSQHGEDVTGTGEAIGSGWTGREGRVEGKITGTTFTFSEIHPAGSLTVAGCSAELAGSLEVRTIQVPEQVSTPPPYSPYYPPYYPTSPNNPPSTIMQTVMSGVVRGTACGTPFSGMLSIYRD
jgi:hypothetical protein